MTTSLTLGISRRPDASLVLTAEGEIDLSNLEEFTAALSDGVAEAVRGGEILTVDLAAVEYLDSAGINALCARAENIFLIAHPLLMSTLKISGLVELIRVVPAS